MQIYFIEQDNTVASLDWIGFIRIQDSQALRNIGGDGNQTFFTV